MKILFCSFCLRGGVQKEKYNLHKPDLLPFKAGDSYRRHCQQLLMREVMGEVEQCENISLKLSKKISFQKRTKNVFLSFEDTSLFPKTQLVSGVAMSLGAAYSSLVKHITWVHLRFLNK